MEQGRDDERPTRVALMATCLVDLVEPDVGVATVRVLRAAGCTVTFPQGQTCCGQPAWNSGFAAEAGRVAKTTLAALAAEDADAVVVPAGSCATMIKVFWPELFEVLGDEEAAGTARDVAGRTYELTEFLAGRDLPVPRSPGGKVAYHHSCHMLRELRVKEQPERLLEAAGCDRVAWPDDERCCGFGGLFSVKQPETSVAMGDTKLRSLAASDADMLVGADSSCLLHLRGRAAKLGAQVPTRHIAEVLAAGLPPDEPGTPR